MIQWLKERWEILRLSLKHPLLFLVFSALQVAAIVLDFFPPPPALVPFLHWLTGLPWYGWVMGWMAVLWLSTLEYSVERKKRFDETSVNFFKAYLEFLIKEGRQLFNHADDKDFYSKISDWQRKAVEGIAIGSGHEESQKFFQKVESKSPLSEAYRESTASRSSEALARCLETRLEELSFIRLSLPENEEDANNKLLAGPVEKGGQVPVKPAGLLTGEVEPPPVKRLPKK